MGVMTGKYPSIATHHAAVASSKVDSIVPLLGTPFDGLKAQIYGDERTEIIRDLSDVAVGDVAYAGNSVGTVTAILTDGEGSPADNRIQVTFGGQVMQTPNASSIANRVVVYSFVDNDEAAATGESNVYAFNSISGEGVVFVRVLDAI